MSKSNALEPPPPLKLDSAAQTETEDPLVVRRKQSGFHLFVKRRKSKASSLRSSNHRKSLAVDEDDSLQSAGAGPSSEPEAAYGPRIVDGEPVPEPEHRKLSIRTTRNTVDQGAQIAIGEDVKDGQQTKDLYRWAVMYENQRG